MNKQSNTVKVVVAAAAIVAAVVILLLQRDPAPEGFSENVYYYDLQSGQLYGGPRAVSPIDLADDGSAKGVLAAVLSCGACEAGQWKVAYLTSLTDAAQQRIETAESLADEMKRDAEVSDALAGGTRVAAPPATSGGAIEWMPADTPEAAQLMIDAANMCGDATAKPCRP